jgi:mono/diheme cytochrome c family protein
MKRNLVFFCSFLVTIAIIITACGNEQSIKYTRYYSDGSQLYKDNCENCHNASGDGLALLIPPLTDVDFLTKNRTNLPCIVIYGLNGNITIHQKIYNFKMPSTKKLAPVDVAKLLTYITNSFGNKQGLYDITEVENHLKNCR